MDITGIIAIIFTFSTGFGICYLYFTTRHRERMGMIERGMDPNAHKAAPEPNKALRDGLLIVGIGLGLLAGWLFREYVMGPGNHSPLPLFIAAAIIGGLSQIIYYLRFGRKQQR
ncbi:MAG: hypothetical protein KF797_06435 [Flavobacteriales bacterium]|nr:hypothetical protein [Flavobacteriales bacterium]